MTGTSPPGDEGSVTLHSSWTGLCFNGFGAFGFLAIAVYLAIDVGLNVATGVLLVLAVGTALVVLFDMPIATTFNAEGVKRRALLRHQDIPWGRISRIRRGRSGIVRSRKETVSGGLVAMVGRRPYVLTDVMESAIEFDQIRDCLGHDRADALGIAGHIRPARDRTPTWSYRKKHWRPEL